MKKPEKTITQPGCSGRLIAVEGIDGSGKSTHIYLLQRWLELQGLKVFFSKRNSSELVKSATSHGKEKRLLTPTTFSLIHAADFDDRYKFTAFVRDTVRGCSPDWVRHIYSFAARPDLTFFFKAPLGLLLDMFDSFVRYQQLMANKFDELRRSWGYATIDAGQSMDALNRELHGNIERVLG